MEKPSKRRIDSINYYINKGIEVFKELSAKNNSYTTLVGNAGMKIFNEQMNGYMQMSMAGYDSLAKKYIKAITPNNTLTAMARNLLDACSQNAILFTFGDNDTYPLWYVQEKENFRKDVAVLNINLLGLSPYVDMVKRKKTVSFSSTANVYGDSAFYYFPRREGGRTISSLSEFIQDIQAKKYTEPYGPVGTLTAYSQKEINLKVDLARFNKISTQKNLTSEIRLDLPKYILNDQLIELDILNTNLYTRPVFFAASYDLLQSCLQNKGPVFQFLPIDNSKTTLTQKISFEKTKNYLEHVLVPTPSNELSSGVAPSTSFDATVYTMYATVANYFISKNQKDSASALLHHLLEDYKNNLPFTDNQHIIGEALLNSGNKNLGVQLLEDFAIRAYQLYQNPSPIEPIFSGKQLMDLLGSCLDALEAQKIESKAIMDLVVKLYAE